MVQFSDYFFKGTMIELYDDGTYHEYKEGEYDFHGPTVMVSGELILSFENGPLRKSRCFTAIYNQDAAVLAPPERRSRLHLQPEWFTAPALRAQLDGDANVTVVENARNGWRFMAFNFDTAPLDDIVARQAIACMIDKDFLSYNVSARCGTSRETHLSQLAKPFWYNPDVPDPL